MDKTVRNETGANLALAERANNIAQIRADWRAVLTARDAKRDARNAAARRAIRRGFTFSMLGV